MTFGVPVAALQAIVSVEGTEIGAAKLEAFGAKVDTTAAKVDGAGRKVDDSFKKTGPTLQQMGAAFTAVDNQAIGPFTSGLGAMGSRLQSVTGDTKAISTGLFSVGNASIAGAVGLGVAAAEGVKLATAFQTADARVELATKNIGASFDVYRGAIKAADADGEKLGFGATQTEESIAQLELATKSVTKAISLESLAQDISRGKGESLSTATQQLSAVELGRTRGLAILGVNLKDNEGKTISTEEAVRRLTALYGGDATAYTKTLAGAQSVLGAELQGVGIKIGQEVIPPLSAYLGMVTTITGFANRATSASSGFGGALGFVGKAARQVGLDLIPGVGELVRLHSIMDSNTSSAGAAAKVTQELAAASKKYSDDVAAGHASQATLAADAKAVSEAQGKQADVQLKLAAALGAGATDATAAITADQELASAAGALAAAQSGAMNRYKADLISGAADAQHLDGERATLVATTTQAAIVEHQAADATAAAGAAADVAAGNVLSEADAYQILGQAAVNAANAVSSSDNLAKAAFAQSDANEAAANAADAYKAAVDGLSKSQTSAASGGGKTAIAQALDQQGKELAVRDALRSVGTATSGVHDAQVALSQARSQSATANQTLIVSENTYRNTLDGVSADTTKARVALQQLTQARLDAQSSALDVQDAERGVALARNDAQLNGFGVTDAESTLTGSRQSVVTATDAVTTAEQALAQVQQTQPTNVAAIATAEAALATARTNVSAANEQVSKDEVALGDARINATAGNEAITRAEIALSNARITAKQKTTDLNSASRTYADTLHGFPAASNEAKLAQQNLTAAQLAAHQASDGVVKALQGVQSAQDQTITSSYNLKRAQADVLGELTSTAGAAGKANAAYDSVQTKMDQVRGAAKTLAEDTRKAVTQSTGSVAAGIYAEITQLDQLTASQPLLKGAFTDVLKNLEKELLSFPGTLNGSYYPGGALAPPGVGPTRHASGGFVAPGTFTTLGEEGFELGYARPGGGMDILSNSQSRHTLGGGDSALLQQLLAALGRRGGVHIEKLYARDDADVARVIDQQERRQHLLSTL